MDARMYLLHVVAVHWHVKGSVSCVFTVTVAVCAGVYATLTALLCLAGQHWSHYGEPCVSDLPRHRLEGGEQRFAVCLPPGSSDVARKMDIYQCCTPPPPSGPFPPHIHPDDTQKL